jgi:hypothetical protein
VSSDQLAGVGAFLSGAASVISAAWYVRRMRKRAQDDCDRRLQEFDRALHEGVRIGRGDADDS